MTFIDAMMLLQGTGVLGLGVGILKWAIGVEKRLTIVEIKQEK